MLILDEIKTTDLDFNPAVQVMEEFVESVEFMTTASDELILVNIQIPMRVWRADEGNANGVVRVYLDGCQLLPMGQWNGELIVNGGQWCTEPLTPSNGRCSGSVVLNVEAGEHKIYTHVSVSYPTDPQDQGTWVAVGGVRRYQVLTL